MCFQKLNFLSVHTFASCLTRMDPLVVSVPEMSKGISSGTPCMTMTMTMFFRGAVEKLQDVCEAGNSEPELLETPIDSSTEGGKPGGHLSEA